jgi:hypothetical protein
VPYTGANAPFYGITKPNMKKCAYYYDVPCAPFTFVYAVDMENDEVAARQVLCGVAVVVVGGAGAGRQGCACVHTAWSICAHNLEAEGSASHSRTTPHTCVQHLSTQGICTCVYMC